MIFQKSTTGTEGVYLHCEAADTSGITAGDWVMWSTTATAISLGRLGCRVATAAGTAAGTYMRIAGVAMDSAPALTSGETPGKMILVQCYGLHPAAKVQNVSTAALGQAGPPSAGTGSWLMYNGVTGTASVVKTPGTKGDGKMFLGFQVEDIPAATTGNYKVWVRCM